MQTVADRLLHIHRNGGFLRVVDVTRLRVWGHRDAGALTEEEAPSFERAVLGPLPVIKHDWREELTTWRKCVYEQWKELVEALNNTFDDLDEAGVRAYLLTKSAWVEVDPTVVPLRAPIRPQQRKGFAQELIALHENGALRQRSVAHLSTAMKLWLAQPSPQLPPLWKEEVQEWDMLALAGYTKLFQALHQVTGSADEATARAWRHVHDCQRFYRERTETLMEEKLLRYSQAKQMAWEEAFGRCWNTPQHTERPLASLLPRRERGSRAELRF